MLHWLKTAQQQLPQSFAQSVFAQAIQLFALAPRMGW